MVVWTVVRYRYSEYDKLLVLNFDYWHACTVHPNTLATTGCSYSNRVWSWGSWVMLLRSNSFRIVLSSRTVDIRKCTSARWPFNVVAKWWRLRFPDVPSGRGWHFINKRRMSQDGNLFELRSSSTGTRARSTAIIPVIRISGLIDERTPYGCTALRLRTLERDHITSQVTRAFESSSTRDVSHDPNWVHEYMWGHTTPWEFWYLPQ